MAPSTALALSALGAVVILGARRPSPRLTTVVSLLVASLAGVQLATLVLGLPPALDALLVPAPDLFGGVPTGRMSPLTALAVLLASLSLLFLGKAGRRRALGAAGASLALAVCLLGGVVALGYLFGAPPLYGGTLVPMAFPTAVAVGCLGLGLLGIAPRDTSPLRMLTRPTIGATLLRAFLPVAPITIGVALLFGRNEGLNTRLDTALATLLSALVVTVFVSYAARHVGRQLERAQAERERSRKDAERLAAIVQSSADAIYAEDLDGTITAWNASAERLFGYAQDEALGRSARMLVPPGAEGERTAILEKTRAGERMAPRETQRLRKDGTPVLVSLSESPLHDAEGRVVGVSAIARDVSEQRRAEQALLENEKALRAFFESDVAGILFGDGGGGLTANDEFLRITGYSREDLRAGRIAWAEITPPEFTERDASARREALALGACTPYEKQYLRKDGSRVWVMVSFAILDRESERNVGFVVNIDARKRAEDDLRRAEERFANVFHSRLMAIGIAEMSSGRLVDVNERCAEFFGYARGEMIGRTVFELGIWANPADRERLVAAAAGPGPVLPMEASFRRKSGDLRHALVSMESMTLSGTAEPLNMVVLVDLTGHKRLEMQLLQAQKMEAVGRLAGGIAHDFNNVLGVILGYSELLLRQASEAQRGKLDQILKAAERAAGLTRQLLIFSRRQIVEPKVLDLNVLLADLEKMLGRVIGEDVELAIVAGADLGQVKADPGQLEQVVMNLCVNARDAMPDGGLLRIEMTNVDLDASDAAQHTPMTPGRYVMLAVSDTGCGIEKEMMSKIFEPFFTTKELGKGTGLGLATVYGIVKQAGGFVWVYSEVGEGTTFKIYLPRVDEPASPLEAREIPVPAEGWETILLVEDEASLRAITREILEEHGYRVVEAAGGNEAVEIGHRHPDPIHLLLTDVVMPGMNGRRVADSLVAARPAIKVLYMSGYTDDVIAHRGVLASGTLLLSKPFSASELLRRVRDALAEGGTAASP
ncbi:MAG TPA: PAS domain S-box protein, partial [Vicinamibacteria bacterium]|nr:PAS domain S-box protein [Vicinamibacteria bacterium]